MRKQKDFPADAQHPSHRIAVIAVHADHTGEGRCPFPPWVPAYAGMGSDFAMGPGLRACEEIRDAVIPGRGHRPRARNPSTRRFEIPARRRFHRFRARQGASRNDRDPAKAISSHGPAPGWVPSSPWVPACERVNEFKGTSIRGAGTAREPGTQAHGVLRYQQDVVFIGSGPAKGRPGMTPSHLRQFLHTLLRRHDRGKTAPPDRLRMRTRTPVQLSRVTRTRYWAVDFAVGTMRVTTIALRSRQFGTRGAILVFQ